MLDRAARLTPAGLRAAIARAVIKAAPKKAKERRETAARIARVERWLQDTGNAALMGASCPRPRPWPPTSRLQQGQRNYVPPGWKGTWTSFAPAPIWTCSWA